MTWLLKSGFVLCNIIMNWFSFSTSPRSNVHSILLGRTNKLLPKSRMIVHKNLLPQKTSFVDSHQQRWPNGSISGKLPMSFWVCSSKKRGCYLQLWPNFVFCFRENSEIDGEIGSGAIVFTICTYTLFCPLARSCCNSLLTGHSP